MYIHHKIQKSNQMEAITLLLEFSDGDKVKIMIKNEFHSPNVQVIEDIIEDDLLINTVMRLVDQIMIDNNVGRSVCISFRLGEV